MNDDPSRKDLLSGVRPAASGRVTSDGRYNVGLKPSAGRDAVKEVAARADDVVRRMDLDHLGVVVTGRFPEPAREALANDARVKYVESDGRVQALAQSEPYGIRTVNADVLRAEGRDGSGATVAVIDSGIDGDHPDLSVAGGTCTATDSFGNPACCGDTCDPANTCNHEWTDDQEHGTHVAGTVAALDDSGDVVGVAPGADLLAVKSLQCDGGGSFSDVADGVRWAADNGADVINMSLGASSGNSTIEDACQYAYDNGVVLVASAGNNGSLDVCDDNDCVSYPAAYSTVIAVSATDSSDDLATFSSTGPEVELAAPGVSVNSTVPPEENSSGTELLSGTSMSAPHVAGAAALVVGETSLADNQAIRDRLGATAEDVGLADYEQGNGRLDASNATLLEKDGSDVYTAPARFQHSSPAADADRVYVAGLAETVVAIDRSDDSQGWTYQRSGALVDSSPVLSGDGSRLFVGSGSGGVYALATSDGSKAWRYDTGSAVTSTPAVDSGVVYVGTNDGRVVALEDGTGGTRLWATAVGAPVLSSVAVDTGTGTVVVTTHDGDVVGLDAGTGAESWRVSTDVEFGHGSPTVGNGSVYAAAEEVYKIDPGTGGVDWTLPYGGFSASTPTYDGTNGNVVVGSDDGTLHAMNDGGSGDWTYETGGSIASRPVLAGGRVAVVSDGGNLHLLDASSGEPYAKRSMSRVTSAPAARDGDDVALVTTWDGSLVRFSNV